MYTCVLHIKPKNCPKIDHFHAVNGKRIRDSIPWPPCSSDWLQNKMAMADIGETKKRHESTMAIFFLSFRALKKDV